MIQTLSKIKISHLRILSSLIKLHICIFGISIIESDYPQSFKKLTKAQDFFMQLVS